jgi:hypothetical protein
MLTEEEMAEFMKLYKEHFGVEISIETAQKIGGQLVKFIKAVVRPNQ